MPDLSFLDTPEISYKEEHIPVGEQVTLSVIFIKPVKETDRPTIVFVPGWISLISTWKTVLVEMGREFPVYYLETREKNSSKTNGKVNYQMEDFARDIAVVTDRLNVQDGKFILCGSSLGATAIVESYRFLNKNPLCLVLIGINAVFRIPKFWQCVVYLFPPRLYILMKPVIKWYLRNFRLDIHSDRAQYEKYCNNLEAANPWKLKKAALALAHYEIWSHLTDIPIPVLLIAATKDELHEHENIIKIGDRITNSTVIDMETNFNSHSPALVEEIRRFISRFSR